MNTEEKNEEITRVRDFIKKKYPNFNWRKLVITFSKKMPGVIVAVGPMGGKTKIILDDGTGFRKDFLNKEFVKKALGPSSETAC